MCVFVGFFSPIWPLDDETAAPVFWHDLSLHIRPLWWSLSAWHARICPWLINPPHTHVCVCSLPHLHTHMCTQITSGSSTTSCLFLSYTRTNTLPSIHLSITAPEKVRRTKLPSPQRKFSSLTPQTDLKTDTHVHICLLYEHIVIQRLYQWSESQPFVYKHGGNVSIHIQSRVRALF